MTFSGRREMHGKVIMAVVGWSPFNEYTIIDWHVTWWWRQPLQ